MRENILSICERNFILKAAQEHKRLDGRNLEEFRNLKVYFGQDWGLCYVSLGQTKVLTQVTCEIQEPKTTRPNEGLLFINVELSSMAAPNFEPGRSSDLSIHVNRLLEKCIKDSKAVDLESLCIVAEEKVWALKVDVNVLNHEGSLVDCASISALAALAHFKRPDVTTDGKKIVVHSISDRDPIPIVLHHYPTCVSFALLNNSENIFADPTVIEERVSDASLTFGINAYNEICCLHLGGSALTKPKLILTCCNSAARRAKEVVDIIKEALKNDNEARQSKKQIGFAESFEWNKINAISEEPPKIRLSKFTSSKLNSMDVSVNSDENNFVIVDMGENCAELSTSNTGKTGAKPPPKKIMKKSSDKDSIEPILIDQIPDTIGEGGPSKWEVDIKVPNSSDSDSSVEEEKEICEVPIEPKPIESIELSGDSEEDEVVILDSNMQSTKTQKRSQTTTGNNKTNLNKNTTVTGKSKRKRKKGKKTTA